MKTRRITYVRDGNHSLEKCCLQRIELSGNVVVGCSIQAGGQLGGLVCSCVRRRLSSDAAAKVADVKYLGT